MAYGTLLLALCVSAMTVKGEQRWHQFTQITQAEKFHKARKPLAAQQEKKSHVGSTVLSVSGHAKFPQTTTIGPAKKASCLVTTHIGRLMCSGA